MSDFRAPKEYKPDAEADFFLSLVPHIGRGDGDAHDALVFELCKLSPGQAKETLAAMAGQGVFVAGSTDPFDKIAALYGPSSFDARRNFSSVTECKHEGK